MSGAGASAAACSWTPFGGQRRRLQTVAAFALIVNAKDQGAAAFYA